MAKADGSITAQVSKGQQTKAVAVLKRDYQKKMNKRQLINLTVRLEVYFRLKLVDRKLRFEHEY